MHKPYFTKSLSYELEEYYSILLFRMFFIWGSKRNKDHPDSNSTWIATSNKHFSKLPLESPPSLHPWIKQTLINPHIPLKLPQISPRHLHPQIQFANQPATALNAGLNKVHLITNTWKNKANSNKVSITEWNNNETLSVNYEC